MHKNFIAVLLLFITSFSTGQNIFVSGDKNNILYIGVDNPLTIAVENFKSEDIIAKVDKGQLIGGYGRSYIYRGVELGIVKITIYNKSNLIEIGQVFFRAKKIPDPIASVDVSKGGGVTNLPFKIPTYIRAELREFDYDARFEIDSFTVSIAYIDKGISRDFFNVGNKLTEELRKALGEMKKNDIAVFKKIYAKGPDQLSRFLSPIVYYSEK